MSGILTLACIYRPMPNSEGPWLTFLLPGSVSTLFSLLTFTLGRTSINFIAVLSLLPFNIDHGF